MSDQQIEQEIQAKGKTAPRITPTDIEACIANVHYFTAADGVAGAIGAELYPVAESDIGSSKTVEVISVNPTLGLLTFCVLILRNGFTVTGESACASPENFDPEIGRKIARQNAIQKIWPLEGYLLKEKLSHDRHL
ncbi:Gp49 family protein [uncultured Deefgea sp.]|uniref:Gp49 family protein n=1 Tax=uncultured Deefgea sp. TaxID=1304914 RepID=UPI00261DF1F5|nr:Gp49 family protein [uncultured Deefgea sp.]